MFLLLALMREHWSLPGQLSSRRQSESRALPLAGIVYSV